MPIFKFLAVTGSILVALLFVANATLTPHGPLFTNNSEGLPRSEPMRGQAQAQVPAQERPRAPALVQVAPPQTVAPAAAVATAPVETPTPLAAETTVSASATPKAVAASTPVPPEAVTASAPAAVAAAAIVEATPAPTKRRRVARKHDRDDDFAAYQDRPYARDRRGPVENGYPYGVRPSEARAERRDWQRQWSGGDFDQNRSRF
jgi:hypothetical protein